MKDSENIRAFNYLTLAIFNRLYESFPERKDFSDLRFVIEAVVDYGPDSDESKYSSLFSDTMSWLEEEGFIRVEAKAYGPAFIGVVLTIKGLAMLGSVPSSIDEGDDRSFIDYIREIVSDGIKSSSSEAVSSLIKSLFNTMAN